MQICKNQGECNPSDNGVRVVHRFPFWPNNSASIFTVTKFRLGKDKLPSPPLSPPPPTPYPCHCSPSCVRDNGISHCFIHKCDVTINRDRGQEAREYGIWWGLEGWREGERRFKGRHSPRIRNRYEIWLCMNDVSRDHCYLQSLLPPSRSATDPWREGERRRRT